MSIISPHVETYDAWLHSPTSQLIHITVWAQWGTYHPPFGETHMYAQVKEPGGEWEDEPGHLLTSPWLWEKTYPYLASQKDIDVEVRGVVKYKRPLWGAWQYKYGRTITIHIPPKIGEDEAPYVNTGAVYRLTGTSMRAWAHGFPGNHDNNELWLQYREVGEEDWDNTASVSVTKDTVQSIYKDITIVAETDYEVRAALSYNAGATTIYGEITLFLVPPDDLVCETKPSGLGTEVSPYIITDDCELNWMGGDSIEDPKADRLAAWYELGNNIDASNTAQWNWHPGSRQFEGFEPISYPFTGSFDGKGFAITGLFINRPSTAEVGLFSGSRGATIQNVRLVDANITGENGTGALLGLVYGEPDPCMITSCSSSGVVNGRAYVGGLIGFSYSATISKCSSSCVVNGAHEYVGGFVGDFEGEGTGTITESYATGNVEASLLYTGGFAGYISSGSVSTCYSTGNVQGDSIVGGFVGRVFSWVMISDSYARGSVTARAVINPDGWASGFADYVGWSNTIQNCYATGHITGTVGYTGGFSSDNEGSTITDCFWDTQTSGQATSDGGTGKTTAQMKTKSTFTDAGWDFITIWGIDPNINDGYPNLLAIIPYVPVDSRGYIWVEGIYLAYTDYWEAKRLQEGSLTADTDGDPGYTWVDGNYRYYVDANNKVRRIQGTLTGLEEKAAGQLSVNIKWGGDVLCYIDNAGKERYFEGSIPP